MRVAYVQSWCALRRSACLSQCTSLLKAYSWQRINSILTEFLAHVSHFIGVWLW